MVTDNALRSPHFWRAYFDPDGLGLDVIESWPFDARKFCFDMSCGPRFAVRVEYTLDSIEITLVLVELADGSIHQLGWMDQARSHPCVLRWDELMKLREYWSSSSVGPGVVAERVLLLAPFVGIGGVERDQLVTRRKVVADTLLVAAPEIRDVDALCEYALRGPPEDDYAWKKDERFGWLFSGSYPCYSLRNLEHRDGAEAEFPFEKFQALLTDSTP